MNQQERFEAYYADQHSVPVESLKQYRMGDSYRLPVTWVNDQQLLLCSKSPREDCPENPMMHNLPRNIAGSALRTDYCNTPLYAEQPAPVACTSCDGSGEYIDAIGDWRGYCSCLAGVVAKNRTYPAAPVAWFTEDHLTDKSATTWDSSVAERWREKGWPVGELFGRIGLEPKP